MASRISQMRSVQQPQAMPQQPQNQPLEESIQRTRAMMQQFAAMRNPQAAMMNLLQQNPQLGQLSGMLRNGQSLEGIAKQMAQTKGYNINEILKGLSGGI